MAISNCAQRIQPSATLAISAQAKAMVAQGLDVINFSAGEPDFNTPDNIIQAAHIAAQNGQTCYTPAAGTQALRQAIIQRLELDLDLNYTPEEIIVSSGAKQSCYLAILALINPGDEVIIPAPYWVSYPEMVSLVGGKAVPIQTTAEHNWQITPEQLRATITQQTRLLILNSPNNPTGSAYSHTALHALGEVLKDFPDVMILSDDIYQKIYWGSEPLSHLLTTCPSLKDRTLIVNGVSKAYAMTGWRIGYTAGPQAVISAMSRLQSHSSGCPCSISQAAAEVALLKGQDNLDRMLVQFQQRAAITTSALDMMPALNASPISGTFYAWVNAERLILERNLKDDMALCKDLLEKAHIALVPGSVFGAPQHFRLSFALSEPELRKGLERLQHYGVVDS